MATDARNIAVTAYGMSDEALKRLNGDRFYAGAGAVASAPGAVAVGPNAKAATATSTALGAHAEARADNSVALGANSIATRANSVEVGNRQITGLADGTEATDAVTVQQAERIATQTVAAAIAPVQQQLDTLSSKVDKLDHQLSAGIAATAALAQPVHFRDGARNAITVGAASFNGQNAIGISANRLVGKSTLVTFGASITNGGGNVIRAGASFSF
jgi:autotransporter adhesin